MRQKLLLQLGGRYRLSYAYALQVEKINSLWYKLEMNASKFEFNLSKNPTFKFAILKN